MQPGDPGKDGPPRSSHWTSMEEEQEDAKWRAVMMATASSLADVHLMCMAALGEVLWGPSQGDLGTGTRHSQTSAAAPKSCTLPSIYRH